MEVIIYTDPTQNDALFALGPWARRLKIESFTLEACGTRAVVTFLEPTKFRNPPISHSAVVEQQGRNWVGQLQKKEDNPTT